MRILLLNQAFHPDVVSTAQHAADLACALAAAGHDVTVIASRRAYDDPRRLFAARETWRGVKIRRVPSGAFGKSALWRRAVDFAWFLVACLWQFAWLPRCDAVIAMTSPPLVGVPAALAVRLKGGALISWIMDLNPDEAVAAGALRRDSAAARLLAALLRFNLRNSQAVVVLDGFMHARVAAKGIPAGRIAVVPPWSHSSVVRYDERARESFRAAHDLHERFVVMYSGNHSPCHPLDTLLEAALALRGDRAMAFVFIGGGSEFRRVASFAERNGLANILCLPYQPLDALAGSLSAADLHVVTMGQAFAGIVHPCKIYNVLAVGSPCLYIGPRKSHVAELAASLPPDTIDCIEHGDVDNAVQAIRRAARLGARRSYAAMTLADRFAAGTVIPQWIALVETAGHPAERRARAAAAS